MGKWTLSNEAAIAPSESQPRLVNDTLDERHVGKAMCVSDQFGIKVVNECTSCGRTELGPVHPFHLRSVAEMLDQMADGLGVAPRELSHAQRVTKELFPMDKAELDASMKEFESMSMEPSSILEEMSKAQQSSAERAVEKILTLGKPGKVH